jgi:hypothetical protein
VTGLDLCVRDGTIWSNGEVNDDGAADVHTARELGIDGRNLANDGAVSAGGMSRAGAECECAK